MELPSFQVARRAQDRFQVLTPSGRITLGQSVKELRHAFDEVAEQGHAWVLIDMSEVPYIDSAGLGSIVTGLNLFRKIKGNMVLCCVQPRVLQLLELTSLTGVLQVYPTAEDAVKSLPESAQSQVVSNSAT